jgi:chromosome segregation ATPase
LDNDLRQVKNQISLENQAALEQVESLKIDQAKELGLLKSKYENDLSLSHELLKQSDEINQKYGEEIQDIQFESQKKLNSLENSLSQIELAQSDLLAKNSRLNADLEAANELMNGVSSDLDSTKQERDQLQGKLEELQKLIEHEKKAQNNLMTKDVKKWIAHYLLSNPNFSPKTRSQKTKHNPNNHHGGDYVRNLYQLITKNTEVAQFVTDVKSVNNRFQKNAIVISRLKQKGVNDLSYGYIAEVTGDDDRGSCAGIFLTAQTDWEAIVQAKLLIIHVKQLQHHSIVDKIAS